MCWSLQLFERQPSTQVLSCEICEIFKNTYFKEYLRTSTSASQSKFTCPMTAMGATKQCVKSVHS